MIDVDKITISLDKLSDDKKTLGYALYDEYLFISDILKDLKEDINKKGVIIDFINGKQQLKIVNKSLQFYNKYIKTLINLSDSLIKILPKDNANILDDFDSDDLSDTFDIDTL